MHLEVTVYELFKIWNKHRNTPTQDGKKLQSIAKEKLHLGDWGLYCILCNFCSSCNSFSRSLILVFLALCRKMHLSATPNRKMGVLVILAKWFRTGDWDLFIWSAAITCVLLNLVAASLLKLGERAKGAAGTAISNITPMEDFLPCFLL